MSNDLCAEQMEGEELKNIIKIYENKEKTPRIYCVPRSFIKVSPTAVPYVAEGAINKISKRHYWTGMSPYIADYVKIFAEFNRYNTSNQKNHPVSYKH